MDFGESSTMDRWAPYDGLPLHGMTMCLEMLRQMQKVHRQEQRGSGNKV